MAMVRTICAALAGLSVLAACATVPQDAEPPVSGEGPCDASAAQDLVGQRATQNLAAEAMELSGAREFRWIPPNSAVTMDYRSTRLNVEYDENTVVTAIRCG